MPTSTSARPGARARSAVVLLPLALAVGCPAPAIDDDGGAGADAGLVDDDDAGALGDGGAVDDGGDGDVDGGTDGGFVAEPQTGTTIVVETGAVAGAVEGELRVFRGIPYAEPPIGTLRFAPPVKKGPWDGTRPADAYGPACPQGNLGNLVLGTPDQSEDCLTLNVWAHDDGVTRPVMVFIHGGAFIMGAASQPLYDGAELAVNADVTVVSMNYRLGPLGWLASAELADDAGAPSAGNYGLLDMIAALEWVQANIAAFGGDPSSVTVFGESAGAISVCALLGTPSADDLYARAIIESGMCALSTYDGAGLIGMPSASVLAEGIIDEVGCGDAFDVADCLRTVPVDELVGATSLLDVFVGDLQAVSALTPIVDGVLVPEQPITRLRTGGIDKPLIVGSTHDEGVLFTSTDIVLTRNDLGDHIASLIGDGPLVDEVLALYPFEDFPIAKDAWVALLGEATFICPGLEAAKAAATGAPAWSYHFVRVPLLLAATGAVHGVELPYVFGTFSSLGIIPTATDDAVRATLQRAWGGFAHDGAVPADLLWLNYTAAAPATALIDDPLVLTTEIRGGRCEGLKALGLVF